MEYVSDLDTPLLRLSDKDYFTLRDAAEGVAVFGAIGSGKTSGMKTLATAYLRAGMGGLVCCAKPDEVELWKRYAAEAGRSGDLVLFGEGGHGFNFLDYELRRQGMRGIGSVTECIMQIVEAEKVVMTSSGGGEPFWERSPRQLLNNTLPLLFAARGVIRMEDIVRFLGSAPQTPESLSDKEWQARSFMYQVLRRAMSEPCAPIDQDDGRSITEFWQRQYATLDTRTRSNLLINLTTLLDRFLRGRMRDLFSRQTTVVPEETFGQGRIIVLAMPSLSWNEDGLIAQHIFKYMWQRAVLRRNTLPQGYRKRPVFLWVDEAQYFVNKEDAKYQSTCRSSLGCTVYLSQSLPSYHAAMGGEKAKPTTEQFLGNFVSKIFMSNTDPETNDWAARTIGRTLVIRRNFNTGWSSSTGRGISSNSGTSSSSGTGSNSGHGPGGYSGGSSSSNQKGANEGRGRSAQRNDSRSGGEGGSEVMDYAVEPGVFVHNLRSGGPANNFMVDAVLMKGSRSFHATGNAVLPITFSQR